MQGNIYKFEVAVPWDMVSGETIPLYDNNLKESLAGGFTLSEGNTIAGFVAGVEHPSALRISTGDSFYITPVFDVNGQVISGFVSDIPAGKYDSVLVDKATEG